MKKIKDVLIRETKINSLVKKPIKGGTPAIEKMVEATRGAISGKLFRVENEYKEYFLSCEVD